MYRLIDVQLGDGAIRSCFSPPELAIHLGDPCVLDDRHILEYGRVVKMEEVAAPANRPQGTMPIVLRRATLQDQSRATENAVVGRMAMETCRRKVAEHKLEIRVIHVRYSFDRTLLSVTFTSEDRIDFRELMKSISSEVKTRVEMEQIGVRDAARYVKGLAACGRKLCCCSWLKNFEAVSVKMAKTQKLSLNPNTISGMCGRLKCCLRYENDTYRQLCQTMPRDKARVECPDGRGVVIETNVLTRRVKVSLDDRRVLDYSAESVREVHDHRAGGASAHEEEE